MSTTNGELYFTAVRSLERIEIQYVPRELTDSRGAQYSEVQIVGRNNPILSFGGGADELTFELDFYSEEDNKEDVIRKVRWLQSLVNADGYDDGPEDVRLTFGKLYANYLWRVKTVIARFSNFAENKNWMPQQAYVRVVLSKKTRQNTKIRDIKWK
jgi:hypothetical protein